MKWKLDYWDTGEWQVVEENLDDLTKADIEWCPGKKNLFRAMDLVPMDKVKVAIIGQDPYPNPLYATGVAFSIPPGNKLPSGLPPTLRTIFDEYKNDLRNPYPTDGDLTVWCDEGVFLWNAYPSCTAAQSMSHRWVEYEPLTEEIITKLSNMDRYVVFVFLGSEAKKFAKFVNTDECDTLELSHPSPRASRMAKGGNKFLGSRLFSRVNDLLVNHGVSAVDWRLH